MKWLTLLFLAALPLHVPAQQAEVVPFSAIRSILDNGNDTTYVLNFWATWCKPCVAELPVFERFGRESANARTKVILVSLDFADQADTRVNPFLKSQGIATTVLLLDDVDYNSWIDRIDPSWGGAIPATLVLNNSRGLRAFHEGALDAEGLNALVSGGAATDR